jgi:hypothetical protein
MKMVESKYDKAILQLHHLALMQKRDFKLSPVIIHGCSLDF